MAEEKTTSYSKQFSNHVRNAGKAVIKQWGSLIPREFWTHGQQASREMLLAARTAIDAAADRIDPDTEGPSRTVRKKSEKQAGKKKIELDD